MKERPILFSGSMVRALLDGRKTQTRRALRPQPEFLQVYEHKGRVIYDRSHRSWCWNGVAHGRYPDEYLPSLKAMSPYGQPGDRLWVRETWGCPSADPPGTPDGRTPALGDRLVYAANPRDAYQWGRGKPSQGGFVWRPSIHMPRWASRITLEITGVRVERLNDISEADADAEGFGGDYPDRVMPEIFPHRENGWGHLSIPECFRHLWESINGPGSWDANPWVWVVEFKPVQP